MRKVIVCLLLIASLSSCYTENKPEIVPPDELMTEEQIVNVLTDLNIAEGIIAVRRQGKSNVTMEFKDSLYQLVFENWGITSAQLNQNLDYYNNDPKHMERIMDQVLSRLSQEESQIKANSKAVDSLEVE